MTELYVVTANPILAFLVLFHSTLIGLTEVTGRRRICLAAAFLTLEIQRQEADGSKEWSSPPMICLTEGIKTWCSSHAFKDGSPRRVGTGDLIGEITTANMKDEQWRNRQSQRLRQAGDSCKRHNTVNIYMAFPSHWVGPPVVNKVYSGKRHKRSLCGVLNYNNLGVSGDTCFGGVRTDRLRDGVC